jgi:cell division protease FtsH
MDKDKNDPSGKSPEKKSPLSGNAIWYLLALGVFVLFLFSILSGRKGPSLDYGDIVQLVKKSNPKAEGDAVGKNAFVEITEITGKKKTYYYFLPRELKLGTFMLSGKIGRVEIENPTDRPENLQPENFKPESVTLKDGGGDDDAEAVDGELSGTLVDFTTDLQPSHNMQGRLAELLEEANAEAKIITWKFEEGPSPWSSYVPMLVLITLFVVIFIFMMRRLGGTGSAMAFGRSRGKMYAQEEIGVSFDDVAGVDEAVDELREVVEFLSTPEKYQKLGGRIPRGVLLVGPPGTGKTLLAKAVAGEAGVPFFSLSGSDFVEMFVGVGAARVRDMFAQAAAKSPSIIFIDELDALGKTRGGSMVGGNDEREQTLNALLVEMDGFNSDNGVIVMAATNRPETLDPALLRPGRFDRQVLVDRPDVRGREDIFKVHVQNVKLDESVNLREVAAITSGFCGADLANLVNEAALLAARKGAKTVGMEEFNEGVERVTAGLEKKQRIMHEDEKLRVAYHESGHALVAYSLPNTDPVHKVSIIPRGFAALGYTMQRPTDDRFLLTKSELESRIQVLLGGTITEEIIFDDISTGAQNDLERASELARSMVMDYGMSRMGRVSYRESKRSPFLTAGGHDLSQPMHSEQTAREIDEEVKRIIDEEIEKVRDILQKRRAALVALADKLMESEVIDAVDLKKIIEANSPSPMIVPGTAAEPKSKRPEAEKPSNSHEAGA